MLRPWLQVEMAGEVQPAEGAGVHIELTDELKRTVKAAGVDAIIEGVHDACTTPSSVQCSFVQASEVCCWGIP